MQNEKLLHQRFLAGGGEMGRRMRALDWSKTPLGPVENWPQSLLSAVSMLLPSKAQICLFWGPAFTVIYNDAYRPVFGAKHPAALGQPGRVAWSEIWDAQLHPLLEGVVRTGEAFHASDLLFPLERHGFVEETYFDVSYDPVRDESGAVGGAYCIVTETTARVVGERRLALLKDLAAVAARSPQEACALAVRTLEGRPDVPFAFAYLGEALQAATAGAVATPENSRTLEIPGGRLVLGVNPRLPFDERYGAFLGLVAGQLATAIANARAYEEERRRAEALAEIDRAKTAFFSNVSHEFRTPLTLMLGLVDELMAKEEGANGGDGRGDALAVVHRNGQRLLKLVNTLLDFARIEAGRAQATYERTDLGALTTELASNFRAACDRAGLQLAVECAPGVIGIVDREMWEKIVLNLLSNAFKFTLQGGITVRLEDAGSSVRLHVVDTGVGIPEGALPRMFERFHRVEGTQGRSHEGSGIGLALVQELVRLHGGTIGVQSAPGEGATFTVEIPKGSAHLAPERIVQPRPKAPTAQRADSYVSEALSWLPSAAPAELAAPPSAGSAASSTGSARILVADDNADLREYARRLLAPHYEVQTAPDGLAALKAARERKPDLVLSDVMMPNLDGFGLIRELRAAPGLRDVPVMLLSARAGEEARLEGLSRGADAYLAKPFSARELLVRVATLIASADMRRRALEEEQRFRALVQASSDVVYRMSPDWSEMRHLQGRDFIADTNEPSRSWLEKYIHSEDQPRVMAAIREAIERKAVFELEHRVLRVDGTLGWTFSRAIPILDGRGEIVEWLGAASDVTVRKEAEAALQETNRRKDEFLATLSHELRNPLAPLRNALHLMRLGQVETDAVPVREIMERQVNHLVRLVDDLLEMSRITRGTFELRRERIDLATVVRNAIETSEPLIRAARHRLELSLPGEALWLEGDPIRLAQILSNLLNNAARYTSDGGTIGIAARREGESAVISVRDNGSGIAPASLSRIFEMFAREVRPETEAGAGGGLGIGLTLSRRLAEMHGGTIEAKSEGPGLGAEFIVRLPLAPAAAKAPAPNRPAPRLGSSMRILLVDDNRDAAASLGMVLEHLGADVQVAHDGKEALAAYETGDPAVVFLDIGMPGMDGYEVARRMRAGYPHRGAALVALTGWGQEEDRRRAREAGFEHHLVKPAEIDVLQNLLIEIEENASRNRRSSPP